MSEEIPSQEDISNVNNENDDDLVNSTSNSEEESKDLHKPDNHPDKSTEESVLKVTDQETPEEDSGSQNTISKLSLGESANSISPNQNEKTWAALAHLSIFLNMVTGYFGPLAALIIYLVFKNKSRYVACQSMQALIFQLIFWIGAGILTALIWLITVPLLFALVGFCLLPVAVVSSFVPIGALVYGVIAAIETGKGKDFKYWLIGDWVHGILE